MLSRVGTILAALMLAPGLAMAAAELYPMEGGDLRRSGHVAMPTLNLPMDLQWSSQTCMSEPVANPVVLEDRLVVASRGGVACLRRSDGVVLWNWYSGAAGLLWNSPAYDADRDLLYVATYAGGLVALRASDGHPQWMVNEGVEKGGGSMAAPIYHEGRILYKNGKRDWVCLNADTQAVIWRHSMLATQFGGTPALDGGKLYIGGTKGELARLNWADGSLDWIQHTGNKSGYTGALVLSDTHIYAMRNTGKMECRLRSNGSLVWSYQTDSYALGNPSFDGSTVFCSSDDRCIHALDPLTGALKWKRCHAGNFARSAPFAAGALVLSSGCTGVFYGDNAATGLVEWQANHGADNSFNDWAAADGFLFVGNRLGKIYCFRSACLDCTPTFTPSPSASPTPTQTPTGTPTATPSATPTVSPSATQTSTSSATPSASPSATQTATPSATPSASPSFSTTVSPTHTPTITPSSSMSPTPSFSPTPEPPVPTSTVGPGDAPAGLDDPGSGCYAYPNPSKGDVHVVFRMDGPGRSRVRVFQSAGGSAAMIEQEHASGGVKRCTVPAGGFAPGIYFYKVDMRYQDGKRDQRPVGKFICSPR